MLKKDLEAQLAYVQGRPIKSIFFGGGTPSLFPANAISALLSHISNVVDLSQCQEITLEANPGTAEYSDFDQLFEGGVNRLSFGAQSFNDLQLQKLGRIHSADEITLAVMRAKAAGYENFNIDLMHSLPGQSIEEAIDDLVKAIELKPSHLSWYQLTIEPNTAFYSSPPLLPDEDQQYETYQSGLQVLAKSGYDQYEISAYATKGRQSIHNLNYWRFGDYLALGAGAHGKVSLLESQQILRFSQTRSPKDYLARSQVSASAVTAVKLEELPLEFMMNALRLRDGVEASLFSARTGLALSSIATEIGILRAKNWLATDNQRIKTTEQGHYYLNDILNEFMDQ